MSAVLEAREPSARYLQAVQPALVQQFGLLATAPVGVARLRQLILTLAVQGKLVPQDANDESADALLTRVRAQKARMISAGDIRAGKPVEEIAEDEQPFSLPTSWAWARFGDATINRDGERVPVSSSDRERRAKVYDYYGASGVIDKIDGYLFDKTLLLIGEDGANLLNRSTPIAFLAHGKYWVNNHAHVIDTTDRGLMRYLELFINAISLEPYVTGTAQPKMNQAKLNNVVIALPPLAEQARIVARADELMRLCDALEAQGRLEAEQHARLLGTLLGTLTDSSTPEELAVNWQRVAAHFDLLLDRPEAVDALEQTILQLAVRGLLVPQDPEDEPASVLLHKVEADSRRTPHSSIAKAGRDAVPIGDAEVQFSLPSGWRWARLSEISKAIVDCPHSTAKFVDSGLLCLDTNSFKDGKLLPHKLRFVSPQTFEERIARLRPAPGDLVFAREGSVGESIIIPPGTVCCLGQRVMLFRLSTRVLNEFIRMAITTTDFLDALLSLHKGIGAKHVNVSDMRNAVVPVPPFREQMRILDRITELRRLCAALRQRLAASQTTQFHMAEALVESAAA